MKRNFLTELYYLRTIQMQMGYQPGWVYHQLKESFDLTLPELKTIGKVLGYKAGWATYKWKTLQRERGEFVSQSHHLDYLQTALRLLGLKLPFTKEELKSAYRKKALQVHPDTGGSHELFFSVNDAYNSLKEIAGAIGGSELC